MTFDLGLLDSGLGGVAVLRALTQQRYGGSILCLADTAAHPYGTRSIEQLQRLIAERQQQLIGRGCQKIFLACHTASSVTSAGHAGLQPAVEACLSRFTGRRIAIIGTRAFVDSGAYGLARQDRALVACPALVEWVEHADSVVEERVERELQALRALAPEVIVLACTHYSWCRDYLRGRLHPALVVDPVDHIELPQSTLSATEATIITSGDVEKFKGRLAQLWPECPFAVYGCHHAICAD